MAKSESIEALLSPSLRVSRPVAACSRCRGAKIKCDGKLPACTACEKSGKASSCSGANDEFAKGKERSYVAALEAAAERLQRKIAEARPASSPTATVKSPRDAAGGPFMGVNTGQADRPPRPAGGGRTRRKEASDVDDLVGDFGFLSVNATSRDFHGFTSTMSFARLLLSVSMVTDLPQPSSNPLPPRYVATSLIQNYLENIFVLMPFFSETDLMSSVSAVYQDSGRHAKPSDHWFVLMVLAISSAAASQNKGDGNDQTALHQAAAAIAHAEAVLHPGSISGIQATLLLVQFSMLEPEYFRSWDLIGMASRVMVDLGLHVEPSPETKMSKDTLDMRRKVFYCVYALDRNISTAYGRAFSFTDDSAAVALPAASRRKASADADMLSDPEIFLRSLKPSLFLFDIRRVQSAFYLATHCSLQKEWPSSTASEYTTSILQDIRSWFATIPASLSQRHLFFFGLESLYSQILALSPSGRIPPSRMSDLSKTLIFELAIQYVDQLKPVVKDISYHPFLTYVDFLRVNAVGQRFREVMRTNFDQLLMGGIAHSPQPSSRAGSAEPPQPLIQSTSTLENCYRATACFDTVIELLAYARRRWGPGVIREKFAQESAVLMGKLKNRQQELSTPPFYTEGLSYPGNHFGQEPHTSPTRVHPGPVVGRQQSQQQADSRAATDWSHSQQDVQQYQLLRSASHEYSLSYGQQDMQQPQLFRTSSEEAPAERPSMYGLPPGSQPRRSYEFLGGRGQ